MLYWGQVATPHVFKNPASSWRVKGYWHLLHSLKVPAQSSAPLDTQETEEKCKARIKHKKKSKKECIVYKDIICLSNREVEIHCHR